MEMDNLYDKKMVYHDREEGIAGRPGTVCVLWKGDERYLGYSRCHEKDTFNRKMGHKIAYGRALQALKEGLRLSPVRRADDENRPYTAFKVKTDRKTVICIDVVGKEEDESRVWDYAVPSHLYLEKPKQVEAQA